MRLRPMSCCAVQEIYGLSEHRSAQEAIRSFGNQAYYLNAHNDGNVGAAEFRYIIFTQAKYDSSDVYGERFAAFIVRNKLGSVVSTTPHINPNTSRQVKVWVWAVDHRKTLAWLRRDAKGRNS